LTSFLIFSQQQDTTISGIKVGFRYSISIFPPEWQVAPISAKGEPMDVKEIPRMKKVMTLALAKYPQRVLSDNLLAVHFLKVMKFFNVSYGGTNSNDVIYLVNNGKLEGYTDEYLEQTFHHELSSILLRNFADLLDTTAWKKNNEPGFEYNDPENGVGAIRNNQSSQELDTNWCEKGILTQYASSSIENDVNTIAQNLFCPDADFWKYTDRYPRLKEKVKMLIAFYSRLHPLLTEDYFRKFAR